jgi:hypothetical protein
VSDHISAVNTYLTALTSPDDASTRAVAGVLADDVVVDTNFARAEGTEAATALLREPRIAGLAAGARWSEPSVSGDRVSVTLTPAGPAPFGGLDVVFVFTGPKIARVEQQLLTAAPPEPVELRLTDSIKDAVNGALDNGTPMQIAYNDDGGQIRLSFRGTIQAYGDHQLALWARDPEGGLPRNITERPRVTMLYHDPATRTTYTFYGRARAEHDPAARTRIFDSSPPREQQMDFRRHGTAIVVDLDRVEGRDPAGRFVMARASAPDPP